MSSEVEKSQSEFEKDQRKPLIDLELSDSTELWLIQCPYKQDMDFDGQEVSLKLHNDGILGSFTGKSGKVYEVFSYNSLDVDAMVFASSESEAKIVGKIARRVSFVHYPEPAELMCDPDKEKEERDRYERTVKYASSRNGPSMSRSTLMMTQSGRSRQTNSSLSSRQRGDVSQVNTPSTSSRKRKPLGSAERSSHESKRSNSGQTFSGGSSGNTSKVKHEQE